MARILEVKRLEAKKRALVAESEVYRQTLILETQHLRLYGARVRRRFNLLTGFPWSMLVPLAGLWFRKRRGAGVGEALGWKWPGALRAGLMGLRLARRYAPLVQGILAQQMARHQPVPPSAEEKAPAANI